MKIEHDWLGPLELPDQAHRIVSLAPKATETLFALGQGHRLVGRGVYCYRPADALALPALGSHTTARWDLLEHLQPDLILISTGVQRGLLSELVARGLPVFPVPPVHSPYGILENTLLLGELLNAGERASLLCAELADRYAKLHQILPPMSVYFEFDLGGPVTVGRGSHVGEALRHLGLVNIFSDHPQSYFTPDLAAVERESPELVIFEPRQPASGDADEVYERNLERGKARMAERGWDYPLLVGGGDELAHQGPMFFDYLEALERRIEQLET